MDNSNTPFASPVHPDDTLAPFSTLLDEDLLPPRVSMDPADHASLEDIDADDGSNDAQQVDTSQFKWYVVHTYSGHENRAKMALEERIRHSKLEHKFGEILIPSENVTETLKSGQKKTSKKRFFPGYMLVHMLLDQSTWHLVKNTSKITGFVGDANNPPSIPEQEVLRLTEQIRDGTLKPVMQANFEEGQQVLLIDGPFQNWKGVVEMVNRDKGRLKVLVSIFGRPTPVDVGFNEVKLEG